MYYSSTKQSTHSSDSSLAGDNLDEAEQVAAAQLTTGGRTVGTRSMARRASEHTVEACVGGESSAVSTSDAKVEGVGDSLNYTVCTTYLRVAALVIAMPGLWEDANNPKLH